MSLATATFILMLLQVIFGLVGVLFTIAPYFDRKVSSDDRRALADAVNEPVARKSSDTPDSLLAYDGRESPSREATRQLRRSLAEAVLVATENAFTIFSAKDCCRHNI